jgi:hypothetical protein
MSVDFFIAFGVMFTGYCVVRVALWWEFQRYSYRPASTPFNGQSQAIDTSSLSKRLEQMRQNHEVQPHGQPPSFKKSLLVESRREQLARSGFFQKPPQSEPPEEEHGMTVLLV